MDTFKYEIMSGIDPKELKSYFMHISTENRDSNCYSAEDWMVEIIELPPNKHHNIIIPSTKLTFTGDKSICEKVIFTFRKKFMRGGG